MATDHPTFTTTTYRYTGARGRLFLILPAPKPVGPWYWASHLSFIVNLDVPFRMVRFNVRLTGGDFDGGIPILRSGFMTGIRLAAAVTCLIFRPL